MRTGRPPLYNAKTVPKAKEYLSKCVDDIEDYHKTRGEKSDSYDRVVRVRIPTLEGMARHLNISRETIYVWEKKYEDFSDVMEQLRAEQADRLLNNGLSGDYNPTIAKVLLTKHGYREGIDQTTNGKDLPTPILDGIFPDNGTKKDSSTEAQD